MVDEWFIDFEWILEWMEALDADTYDQVMAAAGLLAIHGPHLGRPLVDTVKGSRYSNMKELRPGSAGRSEVRVLFAFDPSRRAIMLFAGDKAADWKGWYKKAVPTADDRFAEHLQARKQATTKTRRTRKG